MEDLFYTNTLELIYRNSDMPTYLYYNGNGTNLDLTLASSDIVDEANRKIFYDPGAGQRMNFASFRIKGSIPKHQNHCKNGKFFKKANWKAY